MRHAAELSVGELREIFDKITAEYQAQIERLSAEHDLCVGCTAKMIAAGVDCVYQAGRLDRIGEEEVVH